MGVECVICGTVFSPPTASQERTKYRLLTPEENPNYPVCAGCGTEAIHEFPPGCAANNGDCQQEAVWKVEEVKLHKAAPDQPTRTMQGCCRQHGPDLL